MTPLNKKGGSKKLRSSVELLSNNRKRRDPVSTKEIQKWRNASVSRTCHRFKPVYTHQFFTDEKIQGYRPSDGAMEEARLVSNEGNHPSFLHHGIAGHTLSIQVRLAPSCRKCCLVVEVGKVEKPSNRVVNSSEGMFVVGQGAKSSRTSPRLVKSTTEDTSCAFPRKMPISSLSETMSWYGDDEDDGGGFELKNSEGGRKRRRGGQPKRLFPRKKEQGVSSTVTNETGTRRSKRNCVQVDDPDRALPTIVASETAQGGKRYVQPRQSKRLSPITQVTDLSESDSFGASSDEEAAILQDESSGESPRNSGDRPTALTSTAPSLNQRKINIGTIITQISAGLPETASVLLKDESSAGGGFDYKVLNSSVHAIAEIENDYLDRPIGEVIREYSREKTNLSLFGSGGLTPSLQKSRSTKCTGGNFVLTLADMRTDKDARKYHDEVEKIAPWFIEIASGVEVGLSGGIESDGGYWKVLYLFETHLHGSATKYSLVGYVTLFYHGTKMSVCQAVCLPPYQKNGHGSEMLMAAYDVNDNREILVQAPAPAFVALRNRIDYALVSVLIEQTQVIPRKFTQPPHLFSIEDNSLPDEVLVEVGSSLNITPEQVAIAFDIWKLGELEKTIQITVSKASTEMLDKMSASMEASYKSTLKRTLLKALRNDHGELNSNFNSMEPAEQKGHLEECSNDAIVRYRSILK